MFGYTDCCYKLHALTILDSVKSICVVACMY